MHSTKMALLLRGVEVRLGQGLLGHGILWLAILAAELLSTDRDGLLS